MSSIQVELNDPKQWELYHPKTEMIVTKQRGRVIFPHLDFKIKGLEPSTLYSVYLHLERVDDIKYKFDEGKWMEATKGDPILPIRKVEHSDGVRPGSYWMDGNITFASLKITNDPENKNSKLVLVQSLHKYQPVLTVRKVGDVDGEQFRIKLTEFMVVTAYMNREIADLKVSQNKFASGFRTTSRKRQVSVEASDTSKRSPDSTSSISTPSPVHFNQFSQQNFTPYVPIMDFTTQTPFYWNAMYNSYPGWNWNQNYTPPCTFDNNFMPNFQWNNSNHQQPSENHDPNGLINL